MLNSTVQINSNVVERFCKRAEKNPNFCKSARLSNYLDILDFQSKDIVCKFATQTHYLLGVHLKKPHLQPHSTVR